MKKKAVTLVEVLVASVLTGLILAGLAYVFVAARRYIFYNRAATQAAQFGKGVLDSFAKDVDAGKYALDQGNLRFGINSTNTTLNTITYNATYNVTDMTGNLGSPQTRKVKMLINWTEPPVQ